MFNNNKVNSKVVGVGITSQTKYVHPSLGELCKTEAPKPEPAKICHSYYFEINLKFFYILV